MDTGTNCEYEFIYYNFQSNNKKKKIESEGFYDDHPPNVTIHTTVWIFFLTFLLKIMMMTIINFPDMIVAV